MCISSIENDVLSIINDRIKTSTMAFITYVQHDGTAHRVELATGTTVMRGAVDNMIDGIVGECGGALACATCHCYIDDAWVERLGSAASAEERDMLDGAAQHTKPGSRLSCQIEISDALDGLIVHLPQSQF
jgi:2Fe-2S ferredoxin